MADLKWHQFLEIGVKFIDEDHQNLLKIMQGVKRSIEQDNYKECVILLDALLKEAKEHFSREEQFLYKSGYPGLEEHKKYHKELIVQADTIKRICEGIETEHDLKACFDGMADFLIDDILRGDIQFKSFLEYEGYADRK